MMNLFKVRLSKHKDFYMAIYQYFIKLKNNFFNIDMYESAVMRFALSADQLLGFCCQVDQSPTQESLSKF